MDSVKSIILLGITSYLVLILKDIPSKIFQWAYQYLCFSFSVTSQNEIAYKAVLQWVSALDSKIIKKHINIEQVEDGQEYFLDYGVFYVFTNKSILKIRKEEMKEKNYPLNKVTIEVVGFNSIIACSLLKAIDDIADKGKLPVYPFRYPHEIRRVNPRPLETIFIGQDKKSSLLYALKSWDTQNKRDLYRKIGITHKLGILLYGTPGTGKTSLCKSIASEMHYQLHIININSYDNEIDLIDRVSRIPKKSIILFEDIDCYGSVVQNRSDEDCNTQNNGVTLATLLNIFDGIISPEDVVFVATTNHIDKIDKALLRDGRFDLKIELGNIDKDTAIEMCRFYGDDTIILENEQFPINPAYLQNKIFKHIKDENTGVGA